MQNNAKRYVISLLCSGKECFRMIALLEYNVCNSTYYLVEFYSWRMCRDWKCKLPCIESPSCNCTESVFIQWLEKISKFAESNKMVVDSRINEIRPPAPNIACDVVSC